MSYAISSIGKSAFADFDSLEKAQEALNILQETFDCKIINRFHMTNQSSELFYTSSNTQSTLSVYGEPKKKWWWFGKIIGYKITIVGHSVEAVNRAKDCVPELS